MERDNVLIPNEKNGVKLTTISNSAFREQGIKGIIIPEGVTKIETYAFYGNSLENVTIKNKKENVTLGSQAFGSFDTNNIVWE